MPEQKQSHIAYYLCQLLGFVIIMSFVLLAIYVNPESLTEKFKAFLPNFIIKSILSCFVTFLLTHFLLRSYQRKNQEVKLKAFLKIILQCTIVATAFDKLLQWFFGLSPFESDMFFYQHGIVFELVYMAFNNILVFLTWSLLYLTITSIRDRQKLSEQLKEQQLSSLMNQINPHFLFNSLNTIRGMIYEDEDKAADLVTQLSTLFRYNLSTDTKASTPLGKELEVCQHYLAIEDIRLGERLRIEMNNSEESKKAKIPTMGLLTIVENAIKHGIANLQGGGTLILNSKIESDMLIIDVINPYQANLVKSGTKVGLKNLKQRIELIFGKRGVLSQEVDNNTFHVNMSLPYEPIKNG